MQVRILKVKEPVGLTADVGCLQFCRQEILGTLEGSRKHVAWHPQKDENFKVRGWWQKFREPQAETSPVIHTHKLGYAGHQKLP